MYKVFINDKVILLTDDYSHYQSQYDTLFITHSSAQVVKESVEVLRDSDIVKKLCIHTDNLEKLWDEFSHEYKRLHAAGGAVMKDGKILMIEKNKHWDLPKGKIDGKESLEEAAIREVTEECGISNLTIEEGLESTYYLYQEGDHTVLKKVDWFTMSSENDGPLKGDEKEGITDVRWVDKGEWEKLKSKSYLSVVSIIDSLSA